MPLSAKSQKKRRETTLTRYKVLDKDAMVSLSISAGFGYPGNPNNWGKIHGVD